MSKPLKIEQLYSHARIIIILTWNSWSVISKIPEVSIGWDNSCLKKFFSQGCGKWMFDVVFVVLLSKI